MLGSSDSKKKKRRLGIFMTQKDIYDTERPERLRRTMCARARGCVHVFDFCHDWTKYLRDLHQSDVH